MSRYTYLLIRAHEDCPITFLDDEGLAELLADPGESGIEGFLGSVPDNEDPNYWDESYGLLLRIEILTPRPVASKYKL